MGNIAKDQLLKFIYLGANKTPANAGITINDSDIVFYSDENKIIVNGIEFGLTSQQKSNLTAAYDGLFAEGGIQSRVGTLETRVGENSQISKALFTIVQELKGKLDGGSFETGGAQGATINVGDASITNAVAAINKLYELVSNAGANAGVQSVNGLQGVVVLTGSNINTTAAAGSAFGQQSIDTAFAGVQSNIDGIQARIGAEETERQNSVTGIQARIGAEEILRGQQISGVQNQFNTKIGIGGSQSVKDYVDNKANEALAGAQANAEQTAKAYVDKLAGTNWTEAAGTVQNIIDELQQSGAQGLDTMVDKIRDDFSYGTAGAQSTSVKGYIDGVVANANSGAQGAAANAEQNAKDYADTQIQALDGVQGGADHDNFVTVQVTEVDGIISGVQVTSNNIASAQALQSTTDQVTGAQGRITNVENQLKWVVV